MQTRRLGRTGHNSTLAIFGGVALMNQTQETADAALDRMRAAGVNHIDIAPSYGDAEQRLGPWLEHHRDRFFLSCKTEQRTRDGAERELHGSLERLRTDFIDVYQFHAVATHEELDALLDPRDGAIHAFTAARDQKLIGDIGITTHGMLAPGVLLAALERFDFATIMFPVNARLYADAEYRRDAERVLALAADRDVGVMAIKAVAERPWHEGEPHSGPWYKPDNDPAEIARGVRFTLSQPVTCIVTPGNLGWLDRTLDAVAAFEPMDDAEQAALIEARAGREPIFDGPHFVTPD